jgi:hypothetical protein
MLFDLDRGEFDVALDNVNERYFQPIALLAQKIASTPEIPSYDKLLIEMARYCRLGARIMAHQICHGVRIWRRRNEGRRVRASIDMANAGDRGALVMSRRAKNFPDKCRSVEARDLIVGAFKKAICR